MEKTRFYNAWRKLLGYLVSGKTNFKLAVFVVLFFPIFLYTTYYILHTNFAFAAFNQQVNYQGKLTDTSNYAVADGDYTIIFSLYSGASGGTALWTETQTVTTSHGLFSVMLGTTTPFTANLFDQNPLYFGVKVGSDAEMTPRKRIGSVPSAITANYFDGLATTSFLRSNTANASGTINYASTTALTVSGSTYLNSFTGVLQAINGLVSATSSISSVFGGTGTSTWLAGGVVFSDGTKLTQDVSNFYWDDSNNRLGIGTTSPWAQLSINPNGISGPSFVIGSSTATNFVVTNSGNVGIGTSSPFSILSLETASADTFSYLHSNALNLDVFLGGVWNNPTNLSTYSLGAHGFTGTGTNHPFDIRTNNLARLSITAAGSAGFGTTTPNWSLQVASSTPYFAISDSDASTNAKHWLISALDGAFKIGTSSDDLSSTSTYLTIANGGNVGIGTTSPYAKLSVVGETVSTYFTATSTTLASTFPYASSTALTATNLFSTNALFSGSTTLQNFTGLNSTTTNSTSTSFAVANLATAAGTYLAVNAAGSVIATTTPTINGITALTGDVTATGPGSVVATISNSAVTLAKMADLAYGTIIGRSTNSTGVPEALSTSTYKSMLALTQNDITNLTTASSPSFTGLTLSGLGQGWLSTAGGSNAITSSTSPTVAYITATSTTGTSTFAGGLLAGNGNFSVDISGNVTTTGALIVGATAPDFTLSAGDIFAGALRLSATNTIFSSGNDLTFQDENAGVKTLSQLLIGPTGCTAANTVVSGGVVTYSGSGFTFDVPATTYCISGLQYQISAASQVTLAAADGTYDRIDVIAVNSSSQVVVLAGTPSSEPLAPSTNPASQLALTFVLVKAGSTQPGSAGTGPSLERIYQENTEWTGSQNGTTGTVDFASVTGNAQQGTTNIEVTTALRNGKTFQLATSTTWNPANFITLSFYIRNKVSWPANSRINIAFLNSSGVQLGSQAILQSSSYGFSTSNTAAYQKIAIPLSDFGVLGTAVKSLRFSIVTTGTNALNFRIDNIVAEGPVTVVGTTPAGLAGSGLLGRLAFWIGSTTLASDARFVFGTSTGYVGIGTSSPYAALSVVGQVVGTYFTATSTTLASTFPYASTTALTATDLFSTNLTLSGLGQGWLSTAGGSNAITSSTSPTVNYITATSTTLASTFPYASSTALTVSGSAYLGSLTGPLQAINGLVSASSTISSVFGGTGYSTYTTGDLLYSSATNILSKLGIGTAGYVLGSVNGVPAWVATTTLSTITGTLAVAKGGTGQTSFGQGWLHSDGTTLTSSTSPTVNYITATSTTLASTFPYASSTALTVSGSLYNSGQTTGSVLFAGASGLVSQDNSNLFWDDSNNRLGIGTTSPSTAIHTTGTVRAENYDIAAGGVIQGYSRFPTTYGFLVAYNQIKMYNTSDGSLNIGTNFPSATGYISLQAGNGAYTEQMRVVANGRIGIGTTTPNWNLQIAGTRPFSVLSDTSAGSNAKHWFQTSMGGNFYVGTSSDALNATSTYLTIANGGNVGIGKTNPATKLDIVGTASSTGLQVNGNGVITGTLGVGAGSVSAPSLSFAGDTDTGLYNASANNLNFTTGGGLGMTLNSTGLGIGVSPTAKLHVVGANSDDAIATAFFTALGGTGGFLSDSGGLAGGAGSITTGDGGGGNLTGDFSGGNGGNFSIAGGVGGSVTDNGCGDPIAPCYAITGGNGGALTITGGAGGGAVGGVTNTAGAGGSITIRGGAGGTGDSSGTHGVVYLNDAGGNVIIGDSTSKVGIGTTSPSAFLDVRGTNSNIIRADVSTGYGAIALASGAVDKIHIGYAGSNTNYGLQTIAGDISIQTMNTNLHFVTGPGNANTAMYISTASNIGIGTTTPNWSLQVASNTPYFAITDANAGTNAKHWLLSALDGAFKIGTSSDILDATSTYLTVANGGNVGIGTAAPAFKLQISGTLGANLTASNAGHYVCYNATTKELTSDGSDIGCGGGVASPFFQVWKGDKLVEEIEFSANLNSRDKEGWQSFNLENWEIGSTNLKIENRKAEVDYIDAVTIVLYGYPAGDTSRTIRAYELTPSIDKIASADKVRLVLHEGDKVDITFSPAPADFLVQSAILKTNGFYLPNIDGQEQAPAPDEGVLSPLIVQGQVASGTPWILNSNGRLQTFAALDLTGLEIINVKSITAVTGNWSIDENGVLQTKEIHTDKLCLGGICITETELRNLLQNSGLNNLAAPVGAVPPPTETSTPIETLPPTEIPPPAETPPPTEEPPAPTEESPPPTEEVVPPPEPVASEPPPAETSPPVEASSLPPPAPAEPAP